MAERGPTLLVVDDDPRVLSLLKDYFTLKGFRVVTATSGVDAFLKSIRWRPRAVVLDLFLPRLGGLGALERIKRISPDITIILISGVPNAVDMLAEAGLTVAGAFTKPLDLDQLTASLAEAGVKPEASAPPAAEPVRALVVDDEPEVRGLLLDYLAEYGVEALGVWDGEEALRRIPVFRPHLVLLDILLPGLSGVETLRRMRPLVPDACVVVISGHEDLDTAQRTLELGAVDYLRKPVDLAALDAVLGLASGDPDRED